MSGARSVWWVAGSLVAVAVGALAPWAERAGLAVDGSDDELVGVITLVAALALAVYMVTRNKRMAAVPLLVGLVTAMLIGHDIRDPAGPFGGPGRNIDLEWGIWVALAGSLGLILASAVLLAETGGISLRGVRLTRLSGSRLPWGAARRVRREVSGADVLSPDELLAELLQRIEQQPRRKAIAFVSELVDRLPFRIAVEVLGRTPPPGQIIHPWAELEQTEDAHVIAEAQLHRRLERLGKSPAYRCYERVRAEVLRMKAAEAEHDDHPSSYWREELTSIEYLFDASPLAVETLRNHMLHVTGVRPYDYRDGADEKRSRLREKLAALREIGGDDLLVPEAEILGGFGFDIDGALFNIDTLKFYEALIALDRAGVLAEVRGATGRPVAVEIGAGWGGFAYQFKTLFPKTCYVLVDLPELFLLSGVYLMTAFPDARVAFWDDERPIDAAALEEYDFVFVPYWSFAAFEPARVDLAISMVSFQEMTTEQIQGYVDRLSTLDCARLYSFNRDRSPYNNELTSVRAIMASRYCLEEIEVLPVPYTKLVGQTEIAERRKRQRNKEDKPPTAYRHVLGFPEDEAPI